MDDILDQHSEGDSAPPAPALTADLPEDEELLEEFEGLQIPEEVIRDSELPVKKTRTIFFCPLLPCWFKTTKEGMKEGPAAIHLKEEHKVSGAMMKASSSGTYKFRKVKQE